MGVRLKPFADRFWAKVDRTGGSVACWPWLGQLDPQGRSGRHWDNQAGSKRPAHVIAFELSGGTVPQGAWVRWTCSDVGCTCTNPAHLRLGPRYHKTVEARFWSHVDQSGGSDACWPWTTGTDKDGYGRFGRFSGDSQRAHRLAYEYSSGPIPAEAHILHSCDNPPCCSPDHLRPGNQQDNSNDMISRGRQANQGGERNPRSILAVEDVREIRRRYAAGGVTHQQLGQDYGVSGANVGLIVTHRAWKNV